ncbi:MAG: methyltransferase domain-containing protein [Candidatus Woesearchaeota archaeon]
MNYDSVAKEYNERNKNNILYQTKVLLPFKKILAKRFKKPEVLDIGCGVGLDLHILNNFGFKTYGIDCSKEMIKFAKKNVPEAKLEVIDFLKKEFDRKYDGIILDAFIHLFPKDETKIILNKLKSLLMPNGCIFVCTTINEKSEEGYFIKEDYKNVTKRFRRRFVKDEFIEMFNENGFDVIEFYEDYNIKYQKKWMNLIIEKKKEKRVKIMEGQDLMQGSSINKKSGNFSIDENYKIGDYNIGLFFKQKILVGEMPKWVYGEKRNIYRKAMYISQITKLIASKKIKDNNKYDILYLLPLIRKKGDELERVGDIYNYIKSLGHAQKVIYFDKLSSKRIRYREDMIYNYFDSIFQSNNIKYKKTKIPPEDFIYSKEVIRLINIYYKICLDIIKKYDCKCVLLDGFGNLVEKCMIIAGKSMNIPCFRLTHGFLIPDVEYTYPDNCHVLCYNHLLKDMLLKNGAKKENLHLVGYSFVKKPKKKVLLCTNAFVEEGTSTIKEYESYIKELSEKLKGDFELDIKMHPSEENKEIYNKISNKVYEDKNVGDKYDFLKKYDLVITFFSSIVLEAIYVDRPIIIIKYKDTEGFSEKCLGKHELLEVDIRNVSIEHFLRILESIKKRNLSIRENLFDSSKKSGDVILGTIRSNHKKEV